MAALVSSGNLSAPLEPSDVLLSHRPHMLCEADLCSLFLRYLICTAHDGMALTLSTFKQCWRQLHFSYMLQIRPPRYTSDSFVQLLYNLAMDRLSQGFPKALAMSVVRGSLDYIQYNEHENIGREENHEMDPDLRRLLLEDHVELLDGDRDHQQPEWLKDAMQTAINLLTTSTLEMKAAVFYFMLCVYDSQPALPAPVKVRVSKEHQSAILQAAEELFKANMNEPLDCLARLYDEDLLVLASATSACCRANQQRNVSLLPANTVPGLLGSTDAAEAALLREIRFFLSSTLRGLGTSYLVNDFANYSSLLSKVWQLSADPTAPPPEGIADVSLGKILKEFTDFKNAEIGMLYKHGKVWRRRKSGKELLSMTGDRRQGTTAEIPSPSEAKTTSMLPGTMQTETSPVQSSHKRIPHAVSKGEYSLLPAAAKRVLKKEAARRDDIRKRANAWIERMGGDIEVPQSLLWPQSLAGESFEDMPDLPGLPEWEPLSLAQYTTQYDDGSDEGDDVLSYSDRLATVQDDELTNGTRRGLHLDAEVIRKEVEEQVALASQALAEDEDYDYAPIEIVKAKRQRR